MKLIIRKIVSYLAGFCSNTFFYSSELRVRTNGMLSEEKSTTEGGKIGPLAQAAMLMAMVVSERMDVGDTLEANFEGLTYRGDVRGNYTVIVKREE